MHNKMTLLRWNSLNWNGTSLLSRPVVVIIRWLAQLNGARKLTGRLIIISRYKTFTLAFSSGNLKIKENTNAGKMWTMYVFQFISRHFIPCSHVNNRIEDGGRANSKNSKIKRISFFNGKRWTHQNQFCTTFAAIPHRLMRMLLRAFCNHFSLIFFCYHRHRVFRRNRLHFLFASHLCARQISQQL